MAARTEEPTHRHRAWSVIAIGGKQQYAGNRGYLDDPRRVYRYDSKVANCRNVCPGDLLFIRDSEQLVGVARIERVDRRPGTKMMLRCPTCGISGIKTRKTKLPPYRCDRGHEFAKPRTEKAKVIKFAAHYAGTFRAVGKMFPASLLKRAALRPSDQLSIEEIDPQSFAEALIKVAPACRPLLHAFHASRLGPFETLDALDAVESDEQAPYTGSRSDTRPSVTRTIRWRRGRRRFRQALMRRYGSACMVTGCTLLDLLEAAHIAPYRGDEDNHTDNGLLLRADIHTLFDLNLLAIDPVSLKIRIAPKAKKVKVYAALDGVRLRTSGDHRPASAPLVDRWRAFGTKHKPRRRGGGA